MKRLLLSGLTLSVLALVVVGATGAFFNDTESSEGNVFTAGSVDLKVDHTKQTYNGVDCQTCTVEIYSSEDTRVISSSPGAASEGDLPKDAELVTNPHSAWLDASTISPAEWIWVEPEVDAGDTQNDAEYTFEDMFFLQGPVALTNFELEIASDNGYKIVLNGTTIVDRLTEEMTYTGLNPLTGAQQTAFQNALIQNGQNSLQITVRNLSGSANPDRNPAGLLYKIEFSNQDCENGVADFQANCMLWQETDLDGSQQFFSFGDIKPGDNGTNVISLHVYDNPAYACLIAHDGEDDENTVFETEGDDDDTAGELQDYITVFTWVDEDQDGLYDPSDEDALDTTTLGDLGSIAALDSNNGEFLSATTTEYIGLAWCAGTIDVNDTTGEISCDGSTMLDDAQSDIFTASLTAFAEQTRHNDNFSCANVVLDEDDGGDEGPEVVFENGFETDLEFWFAYPGPLDRVPSGTNGVDSVEGSNHAEVTGGAFTRWGGYSTTFPTDGYTTEVKVYLDMAEADGSDKRFDFSTAISTPADDHRRDFIFHLGTNPGTPGQWAASVSNNAPGWPLNPGRSPVDITTSGWYTLQAYFHDNGLGELVVTMNVLDESDSIVGTWDLTDASDVIGSTVGGNRYGWFLNIDTDLAPLAFDDSVLYLGAPN